MTVEQVDGSIASNGGTSIAEKNFLVGGMFVADRTDTPDRIPAIADRRLNVADRSLTDADRVPAIADRGLVIADKSSSNVVNGDPADGEHLGVDDALLGGQGKRPEPEVVVKPARVRDPPDRKAPGAGRKQFIACFAAMSLNLTAGVCMAFSSSLIPALEAEDSDIPVRRDRTAWLASSLVLAVPLGSLLGLSLNAVAGRLTLMRLFAVPIWLGWALIATASSFAQILVGRIVLGASIGVIHAPSLLFISEVANKHIRGSLSAVGTVMSSVGVLLCYVMGAYLDWRTHAWANCCVPLLPLLLLLTLATESPVWLRARGRTEEAARASLFYYNDKDKVLSAPSDPTSGHLTLARQLRLLLTKPMGYKPLILVNAIFIIQQFVGIYITIYFAVPLFKETGSTLDPYIASILIGVVRVLGCAAVSFVMSRLGRRPMMTVSALGQAVAMATSGYATQTILAGGELSSWWVVGGVLAYIAVGCLGWQVLPWSMMAELFPHEVRGLAQQINSSTAHIYMFAMLQVYPTLQHLLGGAAGIQYMFAAASALSAVFILVFLPETRGRTLQEIEDYFRNNTTFLTERRRRRHAKATVKQAELQLL